PEGPSGRGGRSCRLGNYARRTGRNAADRCIRAGCKRSGPIVCSAIVAIIVDGEGPAGTRGQWITGPGDLLASRVACEGVGVSDGIRPAFSDAPPSDIVTVPLHDALPICPEGPSGRGGRSCRLGNYARRAGRNATDRGFSAGCERSGPIVCNAVVAIVLDGEV